MTVPVGGAWAAVSAMVDYLNANLNTHVATIRSRYSETTTTLPDVDDAVTQPLWLLSASTKVPVGVTVASAGPQDPSPYALWDYRIEVSLLVMDAVVGASGSDHVRAAAQYHEAIHLCLRAPEASTLGDADGVNQTMLAGAEYIGEPDGSPTTNLLVACTVRMQEASS